jgi:putative ATPase
MEELGYADGYKDPHRYPENFVPQQYLPDKLDKKVYYEPTENGYESRIAERLRKWRKLAQ